MWVYNASTLDVRCASMEPSSVAACRNRTSRWQGATERCRDTVKTSIHPEFNGDFNTRPVAVARHADDTLVRFEANAITVNMN